MLVNIQKDMYRSFPLYAFDIPLLHENPPPYVKSMYMNSHKQIVYGFPMSLLIHVCSFLCSLSYMCFPL